MTDARDIVDDMLTDAKKTERRGKVYCFSRWVGFYALPVFCIACALFLLLKSFDDPSVPDSIDCYSLACDIRVIEGKPRSKGAEQSYIFRDGIGCRVRFEGEWYSFEEGKAVLRRATSGEKKQ